MPKPDEALLKHMLDACRDMAEILVGRTRSDLDTDKLLYNAVIRLVLVVGEAAARIGPATRERLPGPPWTLMAATRNRLVHGYYDIDPDRLWITASESLPALRRELEASGLV